MNPPSVGKPKSVTSLVLLFPAIAAFPLIAEGQTPNGPDTAPKSGPTETVMLVREWEPQNGKLVGWLPMHMATLELEALDKSANPHFTRDDALKLKWPRRPVESRDASDLRISPEPRTFEGQSWLPTKRDPNLVTIARRYYIVRRIIFGESVPTLVSPRSSAASGFVSRQIP
jgi:hypothetical protein